MESKEAFQIKLKEFWPENAPDSSNVQKSEWYFKILNYTRTCQF